MPIVEAVGSTSLKKFLGNNAIEKAMGDAVLAAEVEAKAIWEAPDLGEDDKRAQIAAIMDPEAIKARKLAARAAVKAAARKAAAEEAAAETAALAQQGDQDDQA